MGDKKTGKKNLHPQNELKNDTKTMSINWL